jgi:6-phosphogluconolactonase (cycloisomerase 2 family)
MKPEEPSSGLSSSAVSRRSFLKTSAAFAVASSAMASGAVAATGRRKTLAYVGTNTRNAHGKGIYLFERDPATGKLTLLKLAADAVNSTWLAFHPSGRHLYAIHEIDSYEGKNGSVSAYAVDRASGDLRLLNTVSSRGAGPAYLSLDRSGKFAFVANYYGGNVAVLPIQPDGSLGEAVDFRQDTGHLGSTHATSAAAGSFAISGHDAPHAHMIHPDPENRFVLYTDLGQDRIYVCRFDAASGKLTPAATPFVSVPTGDGPRHFAFHPNRRWMYSIQEEASTVAFFHYDERTGGLAAKQTVSSLPPGFAGSSFGSEILVSADGRFLYAGNRLHNSVAIFAIGGNGELKWAGEAWVRGDYPSQFNLDPSGDFLYACNQNSDQITSFRVNKRTGQLSFTGQYTPVGSPMCIVFLG